MTWEIKEGIQPERAGKGKRTSCHNTCTNKSEEETTITKTTA